MPTKPCLIPGCGKPQAMSMKGLCMTCYSAAKKKVDSGATTWEKLTAAGLAEAPKTPFDLAFEKLQEGGG